MAEKRKYTPRKYNPDYQYTFTSEQLYECYVNQKMGQRQIAARFHCDVRKVREAMQRDGLVVRSPGKRSDHRKDGLKGRETIRKRIATDPAYVLKTKLRNYPDSLKGHYKRYSKGAASRNYPFELTIDQFETLVIQPCYYCGHPPLYKIGKYYFNGIDRTNNDLGYIEGNVRPCCGTCNKAKLDRHEEDFIKWVLRAAEHIKSTGIHLTLNVAGGEE